MRVKFWGVRGSIPVPGPQTARYGGNTSCLEIVGAQGECIIMEGGSGLRPLGLELMARGKPLPPIHLYITHTHWDHIQGVPFFVPCYLPGARIEVKGPVHYVEKKPLEEIFDMQMRYEFFPVSNEQLAADIDYEAIGETSWQVEGVAIRTQFTNHPIRSLGYRLTEGERTLVYTGDHEPYYNLFNPEGEEEDELLFGGVDETVEVASQRFIEFIREVELLILDSQYTPQEYRTSKRNWGHSPWDACLEWMKASGAKRMVLTHHDPERTDEELDRVSAEVRAAAAKMNLDPDTIAVAREGMELEV